MAVMGRNSTCRTTCRTVGPAASDEAPASPSAADPPAPNAFTGRFLERLSAEDQPETALAATREGPWTVVPNGHGRWAVFREGESYADGDAPAALFAERHQALLAAAALPGTAERGTLRLVDRCLPGGYPVTDGRRTLGQLAWFDPDLVGALAVLRAVAASPHALALLLAAAGHDGLERAGRILARRVADEEPAA